MKFNLDFQVATSVSAHNILKKLSGVDDSDGGKGRQKNPKAPFRTMSHAILFAFMFGLFYGEREPLKNRSGNWHFSSIQRAANQQNMYDLASLLQNFGNPEDISSQDAAQTAVMEYINWGLIELESQEFGVNDYLFGDYLKKLLE